MLFPLIGAGLGGFEGYRRSGGDIGAALLGAGLGAVTPTGLRMAGTALGTGLAGMGLKTQAANLVGMGAQAARKSGLEPVGRLLSKGAGRVMGLDPAKLGALAAGGGLFLGAPAIAGALAGSAAKPIGKAAQAASQALGVTGQVTGLGQTSLPGVPTVPNADLVQYGPQNLVQTFDPTGHQMAQLALQDEQYKRNMLSALRYAPYQEAYQQRSKEADLIRGAKAAQLSTALATDAAMRQQGQLGAQRMAEGFLGNIGQAGATQYRYF